MRGRKLTNKYRNKKHFKKTANRVHPRNHPLAVKPRGGMRL